MSTVAIALAVSCSVCGVEPADFGSAFADVYGAFAPLSLIHRAYADHLFYGTDVAIPKDLHVSCDETGYLLAALQLDFLTQTRSEVAAVVPRLARLRADLAEFCERHSEVLATLSALEVSDMSVLKDASELGVFSDIYQLQTELQSVFETYLNGLSDEQDIWRFGVAFSLRTLLAQATLAEVDSNLLSILYGSEEAVSPPSFVPAEIASCIERLGLFVDVPLDDAGVNEVRHLAQIIYAYVVEQAIGMGGGKAGC